MTRLAFADKVAIVTGAGGGIGRSHALELAGRGAQVVVNDIGGSKEGTDASTSPAQSVVDEIISAGGVAIANYDTVATPEGGANVVRMALKEFGGVHIVVNNAGILRDASFKNMTIVDLDLVLDVHLRGTFNIIKPVWQLMRDQNYGRIVNTASGSGLFGNFGQTNYAAAKMGIVGLTRALALEGRKNDIKVNAIAPVARTRMTEELLGETADRLDPKYVASLVAYLAHQECAISGEIYSVGAGRVARIFVALGSGFVDDELSAESIRDNLDAVRSTDGYVVPRSVVDEMKAVLASTLDAEAVVK